MLAFFCLGACYRPWRYFAALHFRVFGDGASPRRTCCSPQPRQHSVFRASGGGRSPSPAFGAVFFAGRAAVIWCGANPGVRPWQDLRECALGRLVVAIFSRGAFPSVYPWQYSAAVRSRAAIRDNFFASCIPKVASDGKIASSRQDSRAMHPKRAGFGRICAPCIRKAPQTAFRERTARRSCHEGAAFAARTPRIMHGAQILPSAVVPNRPSARNPGAAEQREPPELDRPAQETQPGRQRPRRLLGSKCRQQLPRYRHCSLPTPASSLLPGEQLCHCRQRHLWRQHPRRHRPADSPSCARPKRGLSSLLVVPVFCALGRCDRFVNARRSLFYAIISLWLRKNRHPSGKTQALPIQWVGCSRGHVPYRTINKEKRLRWQLLHIALSARKRRKW